MIGIIDTSDYAKGNIYNILHINEKVIENFKMNTMVKYGRISRIKIKNVCCKAGR